MPLKDLDGIVEAVRYRQDGSIEAVRYYQRRGSVWSDALLLDRAGLLLLLKDGRKFVAGRRKRDQGGEFDVGAALRCEDRRIRSGATRANRDHLENVPIF